ncbi:MAG: hypothetical protein HWN65_19835 [Candidatus Helarchaeota archaeon]|nr:hypothetical protein [Candidatus Helarchaeota archaeon]
MLTIPEADFLALTLSSVFVIILLIAFTGALFLEKHRSKLAILSGVMAALLLGVMVFALATPFIFPP